MKKFCKICIVIVLSVSALLCGCTSVGDNSVQIINYYLNQSYSSVNLEVRNGFSDGSEIVSNFVIAYSDDQTSVTYEYRQFATFGETVPENYYTVSKGTAVLKNGEVTLSGDSVDLPFAQIADISFEFKKAYFSDIHLYENRFRATVSNPSAFLGHDFDGTNMKVNVAFADELIQTLFVSFAQNNCTTQLIYTFTK